MDSLTEAQFRALWASGLTVLYLAIAPLVGGPLPSFLEPVSELAQAIVVLVILVVLSFFGGIGGGEGVRPWS